MQNYQSSKEVVVFDFDKTLTTYDTLLGFFIFCSSKIKLIYKLPIYILLVVLKKVGFITLFKLKQFGVKLFLQHLSHQQYNKLSQAYSQKIKLNQVYKTEFLAKYSNAIISSASFYEYIKPIFPNNKVWATTINVRNGKINSINVHMYGQEKVKALIYSNIKKIDILYTDSFSDKPLMDFADQVFLVQASKCKKIK